MLDIGTVRLIKKGHVKVFGNIARIQGNRIFFEDSRQEDFDAIILATGYKHSLQLIIDINSDRLNDINNSISNQSFFGKDGLYLCGFYLSPMAMLREIGIEARKIAKDIAKKKITTTV